MPKTFAYLISACFLLNLTLQACTQIPVVSTTRPEVRWYPEINRECPDLPSPFRTPDGEEYVIARTVDSTFALIPVTLHNDRAICRQLVIDTADFPSLVQNGLHDETTLSRMKCITGRPVDEITQLGRPGALSTDGFLAADENILSVLIGDNRMVQRLDLTHPQLASCLFHVLNLMDEDLKINRWNMSHHQWEHIEAFFYNANWINVQAFDTKGGQKSIFADGIEGAFYIKIHRNLTDAESGYLDKKYGHLSQANRTTLEERLSFILTGEMEPQYIMRYGFYEGHTPWRTDPIAISFIFGLKSLEELDLAFDGRLFERLSQHYTPNE